MDPRADAEVTGGGLLATWMMLPMIAFSIVLILVGIIVVSTAKNKTSGILLSAFGVVLGGAAFFTANHSPPRAPPRSRFIA
jgi:hypothetical protein